MKIKEIKKRFKFYDTEFRLVLIDKTNKKDGAKYIYEIQCRNKKEKRFITTLIFKTLEEAEKYFLPPEMCAALCGISGKIKHTKE